MSGNPLFPSSEEGNDDKGHLIESQHDQKSKDSNAAVSLIRQRLEAIYSEEPDFKQEIAETKHLNSAASSKHQLYMHQLTTSGKSMAEIQVAWHNYYLSLPDHEKHEVWREFYESSNQPVQAIQTIAERIRNTQAEHPSSEVVVAQYQTEPYLDSRSRRPSQTRQRLIDKVSKEHKEKAQRHFKSLGFGLTMGTLAVVIFLFGFFNEVIIAPFIQPSRSASSTPLIIGSDVPPSQNNEVIIPKINVEIPVNYSEASTNEATIEGDLNSGVVHYPTTVQPGQLGNTAYFGHSSNNIFNPGKYKFAFVLLHTLVPGDTFYLTYNGKVYVYQVYQRQIVPPTQVSILNNVPDKAATATLITCDPPGTSTNRLVVWGVQVSPDPTANTKAAVNNTVAASNIKELPSNGPSLWSRLIHFIF